MNIEETKALVEEVKTVFSDGYEVVANIGAKDTEYAYNFISVSQVYPWHCVFTMNSIGDWTAFQQAARVFVVKEQEKEQEKTLEAQAGELGFGNDLEWTEEIHGGPDLNETVHPVVETNPWSLTNPNGYWHD